MSKEIKVAASILCADFTKLGDEIKKCEEAGVDMLHVDVMDGNFVPNISIGQVIMEAIRPITTLPIETHLMIEHPGYYVEEFCDLGADIVSIHIECYGKRKTGAGVLEFPKEVDSFDMDAARKDIGKIKDKGKKAHLVINPGSPMCLGGIVHEIDGVLIMSVNPGFAKQKFNPVALPKIEQLRKTFKGDIAIDGGVNDRTAPDCVKAGANVLATASYFFSSTDPSAAVKYLKSL
jgi:ribulose-phosphate 3-epimerase